MKTSISACLFALTLAACTTMPPGQERTADNQVPPARIYIKSMTQASANLVEVRFSRMSTFINGNTPVELAINDLALAEVLAGEHMSIWLPAGSSYTFSVKPVHSLNSPVYPEPRKLTVDLKNATLFKVRISADIKGLTMQLDN